MIIYSIEEFKAVATLENGIYWVEADGSDITVNNDSCTAASVGMRGDSDGSITLISGVDGDVWRKGDGEGNAIRTGEGEGDAWRIDSGDGDAWRDGSGKGNAIRTGSGDGNAFRDGKGKAIRDGSGEGNAFNKTELNNQLGNKMEEKKSYHELFFTLESIKENEENLVNQIESVIEKRCEIEIEILKNKDLFTVLITAGVLYGNNLYKAETTDDGLNWYLTTTKYVAPVPSYALIKGVSDE